MNEFDRYLPSFHEPHAKRVIETYFEAHAELMAPFPSVHLKDFAKLNHLTGGLRTDRKSVV